MEPITLAFIIASGTKLINELFDGPLSKLYKELLDEEPDKFKEELNHYVENKIKSFSNIKTFINGNQPEYLYDRYFYQHAKNNQNDDLISLKEVKNIFSISKCVTLIGEAGIGKSTLIKHLFLNTIKDKIGIPILIELRDLYTDFESFESYTFKELDFISNELKINEVLKNGKFVFFLDGFDELNSFNKSKFASQFKRFLGRYPNNHYIITSRPHSNIEHFNEFTNLHVQGLSFENNEVENFIHLQYNHIDPKMCAKIITTATNSQHKTIQSFLRNPLLLCIFIITYRFDSNIPSSKSIFYNRVTAALFYQHDAISKSGYEREKKSDLSIDKLENFLKFFSYKSLSSAK